MPPRQTIELLNDIQAEAYIGQDEDAFTDEQLMAFADRVLASEIIPMLAQLGVNYYDAVGTIPIETNTNVEERFVYEIPFHALGSLTSVTYFTATGQETLLQEVTEAALYTPGRGHTTTLDGSPLFYFFRGARIGLVPNPTSGFLRVRYSAKPFPMSLDAEARGISSRGQQGGTLERIVLSEAIPDEWDATQSFQVLAYNPPHVPVELFEDNAVAAIAGVNLDITQSVQWPWSSAQIRGSEQVGDAVINEELSPIVQVPHEAYPALVTRTVAALLQSRGDPKADKALATYANQMQLMVATMGDRNKSQARTYVNRSSNFYVKGGRRR